MAQPRRHHGGLGPSGAGGLAPQPPGGGCPHPPPTGGIGSVGRSIAPQAPIPVPAAAHSPREDDLAQGSLQGHRRRLSDDIGDEPAVVERVVPHPCLHQPQPLRPLSERPFPCQGVAGVTCIQTPRPCARGEHKRSGCRRQFPMQPNAHDLKKTLMNWLVGRWHRGRTARPTGLASGPGTSLPSQSGPSHHPRRRTPLLPGVMARFEGPRPVRRPVMVLRGACANLWRFGHVPAWERWRRPGRPRGRSSDALPPLGPPRHYGVPAILGSRLGSRRAITDLAVLPLSRRPPRLRGAAVALLRGETLAMSVDRGCGWDRRRCRACAEASGPAPGAIVGAARRPHAG